ncbi:hypothetical protein CK203_080450 [Vitis vinifera]|uniref:Uncharacterized protein n=1 Tax=Vitis vinifera TaxID=29760 RepID=A0A438F297_VITVI|nr:hypothetical protein CK203_080450 [Vitis vinifera]
MPCAIEQLLSLPLSERLVVTSIGITSTVSPFSLFFSLKLRFNQTLPMRAVAFLLLLLCATCHIALSFTDGKWHFPGLPPLLLLLLLES